MRYQPENPRLLNDKILDQIKYINKNSKVKKGLLSINVGQMQHYIVGQMEQANGDVLCEAFIQNLNLFNDVHEMEMVERYTQIARSMCDALVLSNVRHEFLDKITTTWLKQLENFPTAVKNRVFKERLKKFQAIVKIIPMLGSLQSRVLDILYAHMDNTAGNLVKKLFGKVIEESHSIFNKFKAIDKLSSEEKHRLMYHDVLSCIYEKTISKTRNAVQMNEDDEIKNVDWDGKHTSIILSTPYPTEMVKPINKKPSTKKTPEEIKEFFEISVFSQSFYESVLSKCTRNESKLNHEDGDDTQTAAGKVDVNGFHSDRDSAAVENGKPEKKENDSVTTHKRNTVIINATKKEPGKLAGGDDPRRAIKKKPTVIDDKPTGSNNDPPQKQRSTKKLKNLSSDQSTFFSEDSE